MEAANCSEDDKLLESINDGVSELGEYHAWANTNHPGFCDWDIKEISSKETETMNEYIKRVVPENTCYLLIYVPERNHVLEIQCNGDGSQMLKENYDAGYVDYVWDECFEYVGSADTDAGFVAGDGGLCLSKVPIKDIQSVLQMYLEDKYGECPHFIVLKTKED